MTTVKITIVGDNTVGKTFLLTAYTKGVTSEEFLPTVFEHYGQIIKVDNVEYNMGLFDTAGQEDYERVRPLTYSKTSCFLVCFSVNKNLASYKNVSSKWVPELKRFMPNVPIVLVATQIDLRDDPSIPCYTSEDGQTLKRKIKAQSYRECSALRHEGLEEVFTEAIRVYSKNHNKKQCKIM